MAQDNQIFSAPDPRTQNLYSRYTQEQVPVLPSGYLEAFATAAKLRADQQAQAASLAQERLKMDFLKQKENADRAVESVKANADYQKAQNEYYQKKRLDAESKAKVDNEKAKTELDNKKYMGEQLKTGLDVLKGNRSGILKQLEDNSKLPDGDPNKLKPADVDALTQKLRETNSSISAIGDVLLGNIGIGGSTNPLSGSRLIPKQPADQNKEIEQNRALERARAKFQASGSSDPGDLQRFLAQEMALLNQKKNSGNTVNKSGALINSTFNTAPQSVQSENPESTDESGSIWDNLPAEPTGQPQGVNLKTGNPNDLIYPVSENVGLPSELDPLIENHVNHGFQRTNNGKQEMIHSSLIFNPKTRGYQASINPEATDNFSLRQNRKLELMAWALNTKNGNLDVQIDDNDVKAAYDAFGVPENALQASQLAKAYKLVNNMELMDKGGYYDEKVDFLNQLFRERYGVEPSEFLASGRSATTRTTTLGTEDANDVPRLIAENTKKLQDSLNNPNRPRITDIPDNISPRINEIQAKMARNAKILESDPGETETKRLKSENTEYNKQLYALGQQLQTLESQRRTQQLQVQAAEANDNAYKGLNAQLELINTAKLTSGKLSEQAESIARRFPGLTTKSREKYNGYVSNALVRNSGVTVDLPEIINGKPTGKTITNRLSLRELINYSVEHGTPDKLRPYVLDAVDEKQLEKLDASVLSYQNALVPVRDLAAITERLAKMNPVTGFLAKITDDEANTVEQKRNSIIAAIRTNAIGGGNPSNYEQELLQTLVPNAGSLTSLTRRDRLRWKNVAIVNIMKNHLNMTQNGMKLTDEALEMYNRQLSQVLGRKITRNELEGLFTLYSNSRTQYDSLIAQGVDKNSQQARVLTTSVIEAMDKIAGIDQIK